MYLHVSMLADSDVSLSSYLSYVPKSSTPKFIEKIKSCLPGYYAMLKVLNECTLIIYAENQAIPSKVTYNKRIYKTVIFRDFHFSENNFFLNLKLINERKGKIEFYLYQCKKQIKNISFQTALKTIRRNLECMIFINLFPFV